MKLYSALYKFSKTTIDLIYQQLKRNTFNINLNTR